MQYVFILCYLLPTDSQRSFRKYICIRIYIMYIEGKLLRSEYRLLTQKWLNGFWVVSLVEQVVERICGDVFVYSLFCYSLTLMSDSMKIYIQITRDMGVGTQGETQSAPEIKYGSCITTQMYAQYSFAEIYATKPLISDYSLIIIYNYHHSVIIQGTDAGNLI